MSPDQVMREIDCGKHCDMICFADDPKGVEWVASLAAEMTDAQVLDVWDAACCARACGISAGP